MRDRSAAWTLCLLNPRLDLGRGAFFAHQFFAGFGYVSTGRDEESDEACTFASSRVELIECALDFEFVYFDVVGHYEYSKRGWNKLLLY